MIEDLSKFRPAAYIGDSKARKDVIHGRLPAGTVTLLAGAGGAGKSTLLLQMAEAIMNGGRAFGGDVSGQYRNLPCILVLGEDSRDTLDLRLQVIRAKQGGRPVADCGIYVPCPDLETSARLVARNVFDGEIAPTDAFIWLESAIEAESAIHGGVALVCVDTFTALLGVDSNSPEDIQACYSLLTRLARKHSCAVVVTHHLNKGNAQSAREKIKGSTAIVDGVRAAYTLETVERGEAGKMLKGASLDPDRDLLRVQIQKDNLGLSKAPVFYCREADGYLRDISGQVAGQDDPEAALLKIVREFNEAGTVVKKTGGQGLYNLRTDGWPKALQSRDGLTKFANALMQEGKLTLDPETQGLVAASG